MGKKGEKILVFCATCGKEKSITPYLFNKNITGLFYCNIDCYVPPGTGKPAWNIGIPMSEKAKLKSSESHKGKKDSEETRRKKSEAMMGKNDWTKGTKQSEETKQKRAESHKGFRHTEESKQQMSKSKMGHFVSEETRQQISENRKGKTAGENHPMYGKHHTEESKQQMSKSKQGYIPWNKDLDGVQVAWNKGMKMSEEFCQHVSEAQKLRYQNLCKELGIEPSSFKREYPMNWNDILKESIRDRDHRKCQLCGKGEKDNRQKLSVHHKNYIKTDLSLENLISLCTYCHGRTSAPLKRKYWETIFSKIKEIKLNEFDDFHQSYYA